MGTYARIAEEMRDAILRAAEMKNAQEDDSDYYEHYRDRVERLTGALHTLDEVRGDLTRLDRALASATERREVADQRMDTAAFGWNWTAWRAGLGGVAVLVVGSLVGWTPVVVAGAIAAAFATGCAVIGAKVRAHARQNLADLRQYELDLLGEREVLTADCYTLLAA